MEKRSEAEELRSGIEQILKEFRERVEKSKQEEFKNLPEKARELGVAMAAVAALAAENIMKELQLLLDRVPVERERPGIVERIAALEQRLGIEIEKKSFKARLKEALPQGLEFVSMELSERKLVLLVAPLPRYGGGYYTVVCVAEAASSPAEIEDELFAQFVEKMKPWPVSPPGVRP